MSFVDLFNVGNGLIFGLLVGSFLNVVIFRLPIILYNGWKKDCCEFLKEHGDGETKVFFSNKKEDTDKVENFNLAVPRSHCPACKSPIKIWQNIPLISYLLLRGKCNNCQTPISLRYPTIELITGLLTAFLISVYGLTNEAYLAMFLTWCLICLTMIDIDHQLLPDNITLPLLWVGLIANSFSLFTDLNSALFGAALGYLSLWSVYWAFKLLTGKEGMGFGDFKLLAALGAWMGWQMLPLIILLSSLVGAIIGIGAIVALGKDKNKPIPFGPYLAIAGWIAFIWGTQITETYLNQFNVS